jgi:hypothetical protein
MKKEKLVEYDLLTNELFLIYKCRTRTVPYVITWDGIVTKYQKSYIEVLWMPTEAEAYAQTIGTRKTLILISLAKRRCIEESFNDNEI